MSVRLLRPVTVDEDTFDPLAATQGRIVGSRHEDTNRGVAGKRHLEPKLLVEPGIVGRLVRVDSPGLQHTQDATVVVTLTTQGIERPQIADRLQASFEGLQVGLYREGTRDDEDRLLPIIYRPPLLERVDVANLNDVQVQSQAANRSIPLRQVGSEFQTVSSSGAIAAPP